MLAVTVVAAILSNDLSVDKRTIGQVLYDLVLLTVHPLQRVLGGEEHLGVVNLAVAQKVNCHVQHEGLHHHLPNYQVKLEVDPGHLKG